MATKQKPTIARGAVVERSLIQRKIRRLRAMMLSRPRTARRLGYTEALIDLTIWLQDQHRRTKRPGGIGR
jgi:hypothetical protein